MMMLVGGLILDVLAASAATLGSMLIDPGWDVSRDQVHATIQKARPGSKRRALRRRYRRLLRRWDKAGSGRVTRLRLYSDGRWEVLAREGQAPQHEGKETTT